MRILIAGGAGFLGSHLTEKIVSQNHEITVVDDLSSGVESNLSRVKEDITFIESEISRYSSSEKFDLIINMASRASRVEWETYPVEVALTNAEGNNNLIKMALKANSMYVYASTSEVYGNPTKVPTPETYVGRVSSTGSRSPYDEGKRFGEALVKAYEREFGLRNILIRFFNTYGPRMRGGDLYGRVLDRFIQQAAGNLPVTVYGNGSQTRAFSYVSDVVDGVLTLIQKGAEGEVYNIGNDMETRILDLAKLVIEISDSKSEIVFKDLPPDDPSRRAADITKIKALGWKPEKPLKSGILEMLKHHKNAQDF